MTNGYSSGNGSIQFFSDQKILWKLTTLWGFSEAALGGFLHALKLPFTGLFVGGAAVILISLIAFFSNKHGNILRATIIVLIIKGMVSPHTPVTAYLAVFLQGLLGELFFFSKKIFRTSALFIAITVMVFSASQKLIIVTIVFGETLWSAIDEFASIIYSQFLADQSQPINFSLSVFLIALYSCIYLIGGFIIGIIAGRLPYKIILAKGSEKIPDTFKFENENYSDTPAVSKPKRLWWKKKSGIAYLLFSTIFLILSFIFPEYGKGKSSGIILMFIRSLVVISLWYFLVSPMILRMINKLLKNKRSVYSDEILGMIEFFPQLRSLVKICWQNTAGSHLYKRLNLFLINLFSGILLSGLHINKTPLVSVTETKALQESR